jgi:hypothetical protein
LILGIQKLLCSAGKIFIWVKLNFSILLISILSLFEVDEIFLCLPQQALCCELKDYKLNDNFPKDKAENVLADRLHEALVMYSEPFRLYVKFYSVLENSKSEVEFWLAKNIDDEASRVLAYKALLEKRILVKNN